MSTRESDYGHGLGLAWAPDSRSIAFVRGEEWNDGGSYAIVGGYLRTVSLTGKLRNQTHAERAYGGRMTAVAWAKVPPWLALHSA